MPRPLKRPRPAQGTHLAALRRAAGFTQAELAKLVGESQQNIANWELSARPPPSDAVPRLAKTLGVTIEEILSARDARRAPAKRGPPGKLGRLFEEVARLPRRQQERFLEVTSIFLEQERRKSSQSAT